MMRRAMGLVRHQWIEAYPNPAVFAPQEGGVRGRIKASLPVLEHLPDVWLPYGIDPDTRVVKPAHETPYRAGGLPSTAYHTRSPGRQLRIPPPDKANAHPDEGFEMAKIFPDLAMLTKKARQSIIVDGGFSESGGYLYPAFLFAPVKLF